MVLPPLAVSSSTGTMFPFSSRTGSFAAAAFRTSAQAVPSGYLSSPCCSTISARRSGIIIRIPSKPPSTATNITRVISRSNPRIMIAGMVTPRPNAIDSPADPAVCTILFSKMVASRRPSFDNMRKIVIESTATGIEPLTVSPVLPTTSGSGVSSRIRVDGGTNGLNEASHGFSGFAPTMSGISLGGLIAVMLSGI